MSKLNMGQCQKSEAEAFCVSNAPGLKALRNPLDRPWECNFCLIKTRKKIVIAGNLDIFIHGVS